MKLFSNHRFIKINLGKLKLGDALEKLVQEDFLKYDTSFGLIKKVNEHHLIFETPHSRIMPSQIHEFEYNVAEKKIKVTSKYNSIFFPGCSLYILPLQAMYLLGTAAVLREWQTCLFILVGITLYLLFFARIDLKADSEMIERELAIRLNYLARTPQR